MKKFAWSATTIIILLLAAFIYWRFYFVYSEGAKAGILNTFQQKGFLFKTYEGNLIQSGFKANVQSIEFEFSVEDEKVAEVLNQNSGREINVHYNFVKVRITDFEKGAVSEKCHRFISAVNEITLS